MSVAKLQVSLVRLVRSTMLELLPLCLFMDFCELTKPDSISPNQIGTPLQLEFYSCVFGERDVRTSKDERDQRE